MNGYQMKILIKKITISATLLVLTACSSIDKNAPVDDDYNTSFYWSEHKSTALNLLRTADMDSMYSDVDSKEDISDIRDRNSVAGNLLGNALNFSAFGLAGLVYSVGQNDDDFDPQFQIVTYVTYIPVKSDELSLNEQLAVREKAVANVEKTLFAIGSDESKFKALPKRDNRVRYRTYLNGEACEVTKIASEGTPFVPCYLIINPKIKKIIAVSELPSYMAKNINTPYVANVSISLTNPFIAVVMAKKTQGDDFIAFPDMNEGSAWKTATDVPLVVQHKHIHSFFTPSDDVKPYSSGETHLAVYFKKEKRLFKMPIITSNEPSVMTEIQLKKE